LSSRALQNELLEEWERQKLLTSDNPKERVLGAAMQTPGALYSAVSADQFELQVPNEEATETETADAIDHDAIAHAIEKQIFGKVLDPEAPTQDPYAIDGEEVGSQLITKIARRMNRKGTEQKIMVWAPLTFPAVPKKGDFDVSRLRESAYFFS